MISSHGPQGEESIMWFIYALLSAIFAGVVSVLVKPALGKDVSAISPNLGTAIRMLVVLPMAWAVVAAEGSATQLSRIVSTQWGLLLASGVATGLSWLFYFLAISKAD